MFLFCPSNGSDFLNCGPISIMGVVLVTEVTKFIPKDTCISDIVQCIHYDETR